MKGVLGIVLGVEGVLGVGGWESVNGVDGGTAQSREVARRAGFKSRILTPHVADMFASAATSHTHTLSRPHPPLSTTHMSHVTQKYHTQIYHTPVRP